MCNITLSALLPLPEFYAYAHFERIARLLFLFELFRHISVNNFFHNNFFYAFLSTEVMQNQWF